MITSALIWLGIMVIWSLHLMLSAIAWAIPIEFQESVNYFIGYLGYFSGILDVQTILQCIGVIMVWTTRWYIFKLVIMLVNMIPGVKINHDAVFESAGGKARSNDIPLSHVVNLRGRKAGNYRKGRYMQDIR